MTGSANFGTDLSNDHPISFVYSSTIATADGELYNPVTKATTLASGATGDLEDVMLFGTVSDSKTLECASCHDVHNTDVATGAGWLLRDDISGSKLCLQCHNK
jgi:predicted CXXCH cytochrome family protein